MIDVEVCMVGDKNGVKNDVERITAEQREEEEKEEEVRKKRRKRWRWRWKRKKRRERRRRREGDKVCSPSNAPGGSDFLNSLASKIHMNAISRKWVQTK